ncbi:hypothetical protein [Streptomyces litchfieldiae]|uniref:Lipoprotein n=1 Tax=Streptomyces litchfieldiae TaxID=3075543 RepID=A0ABU2N0F1_9ACTN|nr:hypothetical protein [Streptomyces sp. DSM 44938]MDT0347082.1 hypothetical protein [Streptomyces sp. DSM 44938]
MATALLFGITACGSDDSGGSAGGTGDDASPLPPSASGIISAWDNACAVHDVEAIRQFMGIRAFGVEPGAGEAGGGFSTNVVNCDVTEFDMPLWEYTNVLGESVTDDHLAGYMYLRVNYYETQETFAGAYQNAHNEWAEGSTTVQGRHVVDERTLEGDWDEGSLFLGSDAPDEYLGDRIVIGKVFDDSWSVSCEIIYDADPVAWAQDQQEQVYPFTDEELATWVADTYLPQIHAAMVAALAESS